VRKGVKMKKKNLETVEAEIYAKRKTVRYDIRDLTVETIVNKYKASICEETDSLSKYNNIYIPDYQRDFTWDSERQAKLIESIILGLPIPFIFVAENKDGSWEIVDGSQRVRTLYAFVNNNLQLSKLNAISSLNGYKFEELEESRKGKFLNTALRIIVLSEETTDDVKKDMFERINRGSDLLKPMEKRKGIYPGLFTTFIYNYCETNEKFRKLALLDKWLINRQEYEELLLRFFALSETHIYEKGISTGVSAFLDKYIEKKNKEWGLMTTQELKKEKEKYIDKIDAVSDYVEKHFPYGYRHSSNPQTKRSIFEAISVGVDKAIQDKTINNTLDPDEVIGLFKNPNFVQCTNVAYMLHQKKKLNGRVQAVYQLVSTGSKN
jgi:uncharacterized protein with ParB-like and HNH nuclease domain